MNIFERLREQSKETGKRYNIIFILVAVIFVILVVVSLIIVIHRIGKTKVMIKYAPYAAEVKVDGQKLINNSVNYLSKGTYKVEVKLEHFDTIETELIVEDEDTYSIGLMSYNDDEGEKIRKEKDREFQEVEQYSGNVRVKEGEKKIEKNPIIQYLPYNTKGYSIGYIWLGEELVVDVLVKDEAYYGMVIYNLYNFSEEIRPAEYQIQIEDYIDIFGDINENDNTNINQYVSVGFGEKFNGYRIYKTLEHDDYIGLIISKDGLVNNASSDDDDGGVVYKMIVKKDGNKFKTVANPYPIVSKYNAAEVPVDFLDEINKTFLFYSL